MLNNDATRELCWRVEVANSDYSRRIDQVVALYRSGDTNGAIAMFKDPESLVLYTALSSGMADMTSAFEGQRQNAALQEANSDTSSKRLMLLLTLAGILIGSAIACVFARSIDHTIHRILEMIVTVSSNNLAVDDMEVEGDDEMGKAALGLNTMKNGLRRMILSIASTAESVAVSSREISATAAQAAGSADDQKQQVEQIATAMQEMSATVREVSQHSNTAARSAKSALRARARAER